MSELGVALTGHWLTLDTIVRLARDADALGYSVLLVDGDASLLPRRSDSPIYDSSALLAAVLGETAQLAAGSIRLPVFWNAALLARSLATLHDLSGGRALGFVAAGHGRHEGRLGLPDLSAGERLERLEETLESVRALLAGDEITRAGRHVRLEAVRLHGGPRELPLVVPAARARALAIVERHADVWDANVPPLIERLDPLRQKLTRRIETWIWTFARPGAGLADAASAYRRHAPWFRDLPDADVERAILYGEPERCRERLAGLRESLGVDLPILDLAGLDEAGARRALEVFAPAKAGPIP